MRLEGLVNQYHDKLNENDLDIVAYILKHQEEAQKMNIIHLAEKCHTSKSSILRLTQKLGFSGFSEFKFFLKKEEKNLVSHLDLAALQMEDIEATLKLMKQSNMKTIIEKIYQAKRVFGYGTGWGQQNAVKELSRNFMVCEKYMLSIPAKTEFDLNMPIITSEDLVIIVSLSGDVKDLEKNIHTLNLRGVPIVSITSFRNNHLASMVEHNLYYQASPLKNYGDKEIISFVTLNLVCDSLFRLYVEYVEELSRK